MFLPSKYSPPPCSDTLHPADRQLIQSSTEVFSWNLLQLPAHRGLKFLHMCMPNASQCVFESGEGKEVAWGKVRYTGWVLKDFKMTVPEEIHGWGGRVRGRIVVVNETRSGVPPWGFSKGVAFSFSVSP